MSEMVKQTDWLSVSQNLTIRPPFVRARGKECRRDRVEKIGNCRDVTDERWRRGRWAKPIGLWSRASPSCLRTTVVEEGHDKTMLTDFYI